MILPDGWRLIELSEIADVNKENLSDQTDIVHKYYYIELSDVDKGKINFPNEKIKFNELPSRARRMLKQWDVLMATVRPQLLSYAICDFNVQDTLCSTGFALISCDDQYDAQYLYQYLYSRHIQAQLHGLVTGSSYPAINASQVKKLKITIPKQSLERKKIAEILSTWDEAINITEQLIEALRQRKKGLMQRLLTGQVRFPEFEEEWKEIRIGKLLREVKRPVNWDDDSIYNLISVRRRSGGLFLREQKSGREIKTKNMNVALEGDFLISKMQIVHGASGLTNQEFDGMHISGSYISLVSRDSKIFDIRFFDLLSRTPFFYKLTFLSSCGVHVEKMTFDLSDFLKHNILIPTLLKEQKKIVELFNVVETEIKLEEKKLGSLKQQKKGLMQLLLTGQVRVKVE
jgi:type I restriction enzyme S subunit